MKRVGRRGLLQAGFGAALAAGVAGQARADVPTHRWDGYDFGPGPRVTDRLNQGPFGIEQDDGWYTVAATSPSKKPVRNFGCGLVGYTWEEKGPSLAARRGAETLEQHVERMASLPFVSVLYIRCDWREVQRRAGRLDLHPVFGLTLDAARRRGLRVAFRIQLSNEAFQPERLAMPDFVAAKVPSVSIGRTARAQFDYREPMYHHPEFMKAFRDLTELLAAEFDGNPAMEFMDLMQYGFWGEGHTSNLPSPFPDYLTAERTCMEMTRLQLEAFRRCQLAVNTQPDISRTGNREVIDMAVRAGCWLRSDSILFDEPEQIEALSNRPAWLATIMEDGYFRQYQVDGNYLPVDEAGVNRLELSMLHTLDLGANYWGLWTESANLRRYNERYPEGFAALEERMGYRLRPSWIWQRKRLGAREFIVAVANDGVASAPGVIRLTLRDPEGSFRLEGSLDAGHPHGGRLRQASLLVPREVTARKLHLTAELESKGGVRHPVRWACAQPLAGDGAFVIPVKDEADADWRKNV